MVPISRDKGYTLIETLVALGLFMVVVFIAITALFVVADANKRAQANRKIVDNLDFTTEELIRSARKGRSYNCGSATDLTAQIAAGNDGIGGPRNCSAGTYVAFENDDGDITAHNDQVIYRLNTNRIEKSVNGGASFVPLTDPEVSIDDLKFYVTGSDPRDEVHSKILLILRAKTQIKGLETTVFNIQTTVTQRFTDL